MVGSVNTERQNVDECPVAVSKREGMRMGGKKGRGREVEWQGEERRGYQAWCRRNYMCNTVEPVYCGHPQAGFHFGGGRVLPPLGNLR